MQTGVALGLSVTEPNPTPAGLVTSEEELEEELDELLVVEVVVLVVVFVDEELELPPAAIPTPTSTAAPTASPVYNTLWEPEDFSSPSAAAGSSDDFLVSAALASVLEGLLVFSIKGTATEDCPGGSFTSFKATTYFSTPA